MKTYPQPFKTFDEQIKILRDRKLVINNEEYVKNILSRENYYNVINGYKHLFLEHSSSSEEYITDCTFEEIYFLYDFDKVIRNIIFKAILQIENELRTQISYVFSEQHQETNYLCYDNFETLKHTHNDSVISRRASRIYSLLSKIQNDISKSIKYKEYINHNILRYGYVPLWVLVNALPLNRLSDFFRLMNQAERIKVSMHWDISEKELKQYIDLLAHFRNLCAHDERIYCSKSQEKLTDSYIHKEMDIHKDEDGTYICGKDDVFALLITFKVLLSSEEFNNIFNKLNGRIISLSQKLKCISIESVLLSMGFPTNWRNIKSL